jgi:hypothetical protein
MRHGHIYQLGEKLSRRRLSHQQPHLLESVRDPREEDEQGDEDCSDGIEVPDEAIADDGHDQAEDVDGDVVAVVDEEDVDRGVFAVKEAVRHQAALGQD